MSKRTVCDRPGCEAFSIGRPDEDRPFNWYQVLREASEAPHFRTLVTERHYCSAACLSIAGAGEDKKQVGARAHDAGYREGLRDGKEQAERVHAETKRGKR